MDARKSAGLSCSKLLAPTLISTHKHQDLLQKDGFFSSSMRCFLLVWHSAPVYPAAHAQVKVFTPSTQPIALVKPAHGSGSQSSISTSIGVKIHVLLTCTGAIKSVFLHISRFQTYGHMWRSLLKITQEKVLLMLS